MTTTQLRIRLRIINIEYSALVRDKAVAGRFTRMAQLRAERGVVLGLLGATQAPIRVIAASDIRRSA